ncbi:MAG: hypothetical protein KAI17_16885, partial [Thiotrichaceae bacterium]|nr:hypothetical protein [Thiotrichaceae bacterium]
METQKTQRVLIAYIFYCLLVLFVAGCGGGTEVATVSVTEPADEEPPVVVDTTAVKNPIITAQLGGLVLVDGNTSLPPSATSVSYSWSFVSTPDLSTAVLDDPTAAMPSFTADIAGPYRLELVETYTSNEGTPPKALTFTNRNTVLVMASADGTAIAGSLDHSGLPSDCSECHNAKNNANNGQFKSKTPNHVATSDSCQSCHTT